MVVENALVSGSLGQALFREAGRLRIIDAPMAEPRDPLPNEVYWFQKIAQQVAAVGPEGKSVPIALIRARLREEIRFFRAVDGLLVGMDPDFPDDIRSLAISRAQAELQSGDKAFVDRVAAKFLAPVTVEWDQASALRLARDIHAEDCCKIYRRLSSFSTSPETVAAVLHIDFGGTRGAVQEDNGALLRRTLRQSNGRDLEWASQKPSRTLLDAVILRHEAWDRKSPAHVTIQTGQLETQLANSRSNESVGYRSGSDIERLGQRFELTEKARGRIIDQMVKDQESIEFVEQVALELNAKDPDKDQERDVDQDWLRRFFQYVANVDEKTILSVFAQALSDSAIRGRPLLSPKALDTLRFFEPHTFEMFTFCADLIGAFDSVPRGFLEKRATNERIDMDLPLLHEMGLIKSLSQAHYLAIVGGVSISVHYDVSVKDEINLVRLTHVGRSIAGLVNKAHRKLGDPLEFSGGADALLDLQMQLGVSADSVRDLGTALLAEIAISQDIEVQLLVNRKNCIFSNEKRKYDDPFGLSSSIEILDVSPQCLVLARMLIEPFEDFDSKQVKGLKRQD